MTAVGRHLKSTYKGSFPEADIGTVIAMQGVRRLSGNEIERR